MVQIPSPPQLLNKFKMIYRIFIGAVVLLAVIYYITVTLQIFTNNKVKVTSKSIGIKALIPFYYWFK